MTESRAHRLLERLSCAAGPPGGETEIRAIVHEALDGCGTLTHDRLGSVLCEVPGQAASPRVVLDSHLDEVGFIVQSISEEGLLAFAPLGGWWGHVLLGQRVDILTENDKVPGVIGGTPPHFLSADARNKVLELDSMFIDVGAAERDAVTELGVRVGDLVVPHSVFQPFGRKGVVSGKAIDNRVGVAVMCEVLRHAAESANHPNTLIGVGAVQEEVGCRGATTASEVAAPDVAIVLECSPADDLPGFEEPQARLGAGPQVRYCDPTAISNRKLVRFVERTANELDLPIQPAVRRTGGTNARSIHVHGRGVPTVVIGVPARYIHSHVAVMQLADYDATRKLVTELVARLDAAVVENLVDYA